jgi:hypothetical protein
MERVMTDVPALFPQIARRSRAPRLGGLYGVLLYGVVGAALVAGFAGGHALRVPTDDVDPQLAVLLRFMALMKLAGGLGAAALVHWRLTRAVSPGVAGLYIGAVGSMTIAPGLIWSLTDIAVAALIFHAGLLVFLVTAWRDDGVPATALRRSRTPKPAERPTTMPMGTTAERHR